MSKHTPGPWHASRERDGWTVRDEKQNLPIAELWLSERREYEANARLIAAAPEMYEAIQPILAEYAKRDPIGDSDLYDEQPAHITVTLGDLRRLARIRT